MFLLNLRIAICRKEVAYYIKSAASEEILRLYAVTLALIFKMFKGIESVLDNPICENKNALSRFYQQLEDIIIQNDIQTRQNQKVIASLTKSDYQIKFYDQQKRVKIALNLIMITIALGISNKKNSLVTSLWYQLVENDGNPELAIDYLVEFERTTLALLTDDSNTNGLYCQLDKIEWLNKFGYIPTFLKATNHQYRLRIDSVLQSLGYKLLDGNDSVLDLWTKYASNTDAENAILIAIYTMARDIKNGKMHMNKRLQFAATNLKPLILCIKKLYGEKLISKQCLDWSSNVFGVMLLKPEVMDQLIEEILESDPVLKMNKPELAKSIIY